MKYCMVIAGDSEFYGNACGATDKLGYTPMDIEGGFHSYTAGDGDNVNVAIIDIETLQPAEIIEKLQALEGDRQLMFFCTTPKDADQLKEVLKDFPGEPAIMPFDLAG